MMAFTEMVKTQRGTRDGGVKTPFQESKLPYRQCLVDIHVKDTYIRDRIIG